MRPVVGFWAVDRRVSSSNPTAPEELKSFAVGLARSSPIINKRGHEILYLIAIRQVITEKRHEEKNCSHGQDVLLDYVLLRVPYKLLQLVSKVKGLRSACERVQEEPGEVSPSVESVGKSIQHDDACRDDVGTEIRCSHSLVPL
jgi:hypothetical protein